MLFRDVDAPGASLVAVIAWIVSYDALAFLLQAPIGLAADRLRADSELGLAGLALVLVALAPGPFVPGAGALVAALGNALFHVGAGASVLRASGVRAAEIGYFVGPGATGLCIGIVLGRGDAPVRAAIALALLAGGYVVVRCVPRVLRGATSAAVRRRGLARVRPARLRPAAGDRGRALDPRGHGDQRLAHAAGRGRARSGARRERREDAGRSRRRPDRLGRCAGGTLVLAGPLLALGLSDVRWSAAGLLLLQVTTPLTLKALHGVLRTGQASPSVCRAPCWSSGAAPGLFGSGSCARAARARRILAVGRGRRRRPRARPPGADRPAADAKTC